MAPRIENNVVEVMVDNGKYVTAGTVLVKLDPAPYQVIVDQKRAALDVAQAQLTQTYAHLMAWGLIDLERWRQAASLAYYDVFLFFSVIGVLLVPLLLLMRRAVAHPGSHVAAE